MSDKSLEKSQYDELLSEAEASVIDMIDKSINYSEEHKSTSLSSEVVDDNITDELPKKLVSTPDFNSMFIGELIELALDREISLTPKTSRLELVKLLEESYKH
jgi:hypothetical protein